MLGCNLSPFDAWLAFRGLRTAGLRIERSTENAAALATFLSGRSELAAVHYPGRHGADDAALAQRLLPRGCGAMLSIDLHGGSRAADAFIRALDGDTPGAEPWRRGDDDQPPASTSTAP